jgi:hypothetical protein
VVGSCEHGNKILWSIKGLEFVDQLNNYEFFSEDLALCGTHLIKRTYLFEYAMTVKPDWTFLISTSLLYLETTP